MRAMVFACAVGCTTPSVRAPPIEVARPERPPCADLRESAPPASDGAALAIAWRPDGASAEQILRDWITLHIQVTGVTPNRVAIHAHVQIRAGALVVEYATDDGPPQFRFAYRLTRGCVIAAVERLGATSNAVATVIGPDQPAWLDAPIEAERAPAIVELLELAAALSRR